MLGVFLSMMFCLQMQVSQWLIMALVGPLLWWSVMAVCFLGEYTGSWRRARRLPRLNPPEREALEQQRLADLNAGKRLPRNERVAWTCVQCQLESGFSAN